MNADHAQRLAARRQAFFLWSLLFVELFGFHQGSGSALRTGGKGAGRGACASESAEG